MAERPTRVNCGKGLEGTLKTMTDELDGICKAPADLTFEHAKMQKLQDAAKLLVDAQIKGTGEYHARKLDTPCSLLKKPNASCCKSTTSGFWSESSCALTAMRRLHIMTMYYQWLVGWSWLVPRVSVG